MSAAAESLSGIWRVRRVSGLLPPLPITKRIEAGRGVTCAFGIPVARFDLDGPSASSFQLRYRHWPIDDIVTPCIATEDTAVWTGEGRILGIRFCRFTLSRE